MKILLLGASGQVGWQLRRSLCVLGQVVAVDRQTGGSAGDLTKPQDVARTIRDLAPAVIVNAAAYTAVDRAESESALAFAVNAQACETLAREATRAGAWLVHYSTDYVFNGRGERPWQESDPTEPVNTYGRSKLAGEQAIAAHCPRHIILRTSWVYDTWGHNFLKTILRAAVQRDSLDIVNDQWGAPTRAALIADITAHMLRSTTEDRAGTYHLAASGTTQWHEYASFAISQALASGARLRATPEQIRAIPSSNFATAAARPLNSRLDTRRLCSVYGLTLPPWQDGVSAVVRELVAFGVLPKETT